jgi:hypothetical protein
MQALADLKDLLREKVITLAEYRAEMTALHERARPAPVAVQPPVDDLYDDMMTHIAREKARNERKPRARITAKEPPAPVTAADADFDEVDAQIARERALNERKPRARAVAAPAADHKAEEHKDEAKAPAVEYKAGFYYAAFTIQLFERKANGDLRRAGSLHVRGWAHLTAALVALTHRVRDESPVDMSPETWPMAQAFGWGETHNDLLSAEAAVTVDELEEQPEDSHEAGSWDAADIKLTRRGKVQPTLGCPAGKYVKAGCDIARAEFYPMTRVCCLSSSRPSPIV